MDSKNDDTLKTCTNCKYENNDGYCTRGLPCLSYEHWETAASNIVDQSTTFFSRAALGEYIRTDCNSIKRLFDYKNQDYGAVNAAFANFRKTAQRIIIPFMEKHGVKITEKEAMFLVAQVLQDKHAVALSQTGISGNEVAERLQDVAVYSLLQKAILEKG